MIPEISENPTFLRYHEIWRANPTSVVFAPLAEMLIMHECYEEAITICKKGLERNPDLISGRIALARAYIGVSNYKRAEEEVKYVLERYPNHPESIEILKTCKSHLDDEENKEIPLVSETKEIGDDFLPSQLDPVKDSRWYTVTMAEIYTAQGNTEMARKIYNSLLRRDPGNVRAREGLRKLTP